MTVACQVRQTALRGAWSRCVGAAALALAGSAAFAQDTGAAPVTLDLMVSQSLVMFDGAIAGCHDVAPEAARAMQAQLGPLQRQLRTAAATAFADVPELTQPVSAQEMQSFRGLVTQMADQHAKTARERGAPFCQAVLQRMQQADTDQLAAKMRQAYKGYERKKAAAPGP